MHKLLALSVFGLALGFLSCAGPIGSGEAKPLQVACDFDNAPFASVSADGRYVGRDVEMMEALGREIGRPIQWVKMPFEELLPAVERGDVDAVCATVGITDARAQRVSFTRPYFETRLAALVRTGAGEPTTLGELGGRRVAASPGTTSEIALKERLSTAIPVFDNEAKKKADVRLLAREVDAVVQDGPDADDFAAANPGTLAVIAEPVATERYAIVLARSNKALKNELDRALVALDARGVLGELNATHGLAAK